MSQQTTTLRARGGSAILEAAATVLAERGEQASMADVAAAAGMARATVYRYFPNREALLEALGTLAVEEAGERRPAGRRAGGGGGGLAGAGRRAAWRGRPVWSGAPGGPPAPTRWSSSGGSRPRCAS